MSTLLPPDACQSMAQLRKQIDAIDIELISLLAVRSGYIDRAVDLKKVENLPARITDRVAEVLDNVSKTACSNGLDPDLATGLWTHIIEWSIEREIKELGVE
ncbi:MAG: chorismate mutase [Roseobacter sp.]